MKKFFKLLVVFFYIIIVGEMSAIAEPASPKPITKKQSDGSTITFILQGDEHVHWAKTLDGYTLLQNGNNDWVYAIRNQLGELVASNVIASNQEERNANQQSFVASLQKDLRFSKSQVASKMKTLGTKNDWDPFPTQGKSKMLVSGIETGRNGAFLDEDLEIISSLFELNSEEKRKLFLEASKTRERIPVHILNYMNDHDEVYYILDIMAQSGFGDKKLTLLKKYVEEIIDAKNN